MASHKVFKPNNSEYKGGYQSSTLKNIFQIPYGLSAQQIGVQGGASSATATLYTVPKESTFFITSCYLQAINANIVVGVRERGKLFFNGQCFLRLYTPACTTAGSENGGVAELSMSFPFPYILNSGETITLLSESGSGNCQGGVVGFLVRNSDLLASNL